MEEQNLTSDELLDLVATAIDYAARLLDSEQSFEPFTIIEYDEERRYAHYLYYPEAGDQLEEVLANARDAITFGAQEISAYVICSATELTIEQEKKQVILLEAASRAEEDAIILAQSYKPPSGLFGFEIDGPPLFIGNTVHLLM